MEALGGFMNKLEILTQSLQILTELSVALQRQITNAQEGVSEKSANLIIGSLAGLDQTASHMKHIYEAMVFMHRRQNTLFERPL